MRIKDCLKKIFSSLLLIALVCPVAGAAEQTHELTLEDSIDMALKQSVIVRSAREGVKVSESSRKGAFTGFLPKLNTTYSYIRNDEAPSARISGIGTIQTGTKNNYSWEVSLTQPVFAGGRILNNYQINKLGEEVSRMEEITVIQDIIQEVKEAYFNILKSERILEVARQSVEQLKAQRDTAQSFYDVGIIPKNDLLFAEVNLANGRQDLVMADNNVQLAKAKFNTVLRRGIDAAVEVKDILVYQPFEKSLEDCLATALEKRSEIRASMIGVEQSKKAVSLAKSEFYPSVNLIGNYAKFGDEPDVSGSLYQDQEDWYILATASWDFWEWGKTKHNVDANKSRLRQVENSHVNIKDQIALQVQDTYLSLRESEKRIFVTQKAIEQAEENYRINQERYKEQVATSTDVIDAQTLLTKAKSDYYNSLSDYNIAIGRLERAMGIVFTETGEKGNSP